MDSRKKKNKAEISNNNDQITKDAAFVMFLAEQEDIRDERGEFECNGSLFKTVVESRPADEEFPEETWDSYVAVDGHFYYAGTFITKDEAGRHCSELRLRLEKMTKNYISSIMAGGMG